MNKPACVCRNAGEPNASSAHPAEELVRPGRLVLTDDGRLGRVSRVVHEHESPHPAELELHSENGVTSVHSPRELRFIYCLDCDDHDAAA